MKSILILLLAFPLLCSATNYYVNPSASGTNSGTLANPWKSFTKVIDAGNAGVIHAGDSILCMRGQEYICPDQFNGWRWWNWAGSNCTSGTASAPIVFSSYGTGAKPNFLFPHPSVLQNSSDSVSKNVLSFENVDYIIVDGFSFDDYRFAPVNNKIDQAYTLAGIVFGEEGEPANHSIIRNCYSNQCGMGFVVVGDNNVIQNNVIENLGNNKAKANNNTDYGANGLTLTGDGNTVNNNTIKGAYAWSQNFGANGGAIEAINTNTNTIFYANSFIDCGGVIECGGQSSGKTVSNITFIANLLINNGGCAYVNVAGQFAIQPSNIAFYNNTVIEDDSSRWSGDGTGRGLENFPTQPSPETVMFSTNGSPSASTVYNIKNNIFYNKTHMNIVASGIVGKTVHENNLAKFGSSSAGASNWGYTKGVSEVVTTGPVSGIWQDVSSLDRSAWNLRLLPLSPALKVGQTISGVTSDFSGAAYTSQPAAGAYEYNVAAPANGFYFLGGFRM